MNDNTLQYRPLGVVKELLENLGEEISYAYDDLIFIKHNNYLLQFGETAELIFFFKNVKTGSEESKQHFTVLSDAGRRMGFQIRNTGEYSLNENDDGTISIEFMETPGL